MFKKYIYRSIILLFISADLIAQGSAGAKPPYESRRIVDMPTAGVLPKGSYSIYSNIFYNGGLMLDLEASPFKNFELGVSYGGSNIMGSGEITWQNLPGFNLRFRFLDESVSVPALTFGVNTQGVGAYIPADKRFRTLSPGLFLAVSKDYKWALGTVAFHGGINYSFEPLPANRNINLYGGLEQSVGNSASINLELNPTLDDNSRYIVHKGLLNAALRVSLYKGITVEFQTRDILHNLSNTNGLLRSLSFEFISFY